MKKILFCFLLFSATGLIAQNVEFEKYNFPDKKEEFKEALSNLKQGDENFEQAKKFWEDYNLKQPIKYLAALDFYLAANKFNPKNALLNYKIGICYIESIEKKKAIPYFEKAMELNPNVAKDIKYQLAQAHQLNYEFDKAIDEYKEYRSKLILSPSEFNSINEEVTKKIEECNTGKELVKNPTRAFIDNLGATPNSQYREYSPIVNADESVMIFTSRRPNTTGGGTSPEDFMFYEDIYFTYWNGKSWTAPVNPKKPLNSDLNDATVGFSPDGQKLFIYKGDNGGDLYECELDGDQWTDPQRLNKNINTEAHESSASFSYDGRTIYFVSDKDEGFGGRDIYLSHMDAKGRWGKAENLGPVINTKYDEEGVFMMPDGKTLYFSSRGHNTMGGHDIFKSVYENGKWSEPENLGYPINTTDDDVYFSISASGKHGYYASAKEGGFGTFDLYCVTFLGPEKPRVTNTEDNLLASVAEPVSEAVIEKNVNFGSQLIILKGVVMDEVTLDPLGATIDLTDNEKNEVIATFTSNSTSGKYLVSLPSGHNYGITVTKEGYLFHSENFNIPHLEGYQEIVKDIKLQKIEVGKKIVLNNIFFDFDKSTLRSESTAELDRVVKMLNNIPTLKIEISGHTDNLGSDEYNQKLSENRAKAVVDYLIAKGIAKDRLTFKGYGESQPISDNTTDEGRQLNRRTEFKVLSN